nr:hypothetical protein [Granulicella arctica]
MYDLPGPAVAGEEIGGDHVEPWRLTAVRELISQTHRQAFPFCVASDHIAVQNTAYEQLLGRETDAMEWAARPVEKRHHSFKLLATLNHRSETVHYKYIFGMKHRESVGVMTRQGIIVDSEGVPARNVDRLKTTATTKCDSFTCAHRRDQTC